MLTAMEPAYVDTQAKLLFVFWEWRGGYKTMIPFSILFIRPNELTPAIFCLVNSFRSACYFLFFTTVLPPPQYRGLGVWEIGFPAQLSIILIFMNHDQALRLPQNSE